MNNNNFSIKTQDFEGPFDILLDLILKKKLSVNDLSLAQITDEYILYVKNNEFVLKDAASFVLVASTLMFLKSKSLLPHLVFESEEKENVDELKKRLLFLSEIKKVSEKIKSKFQKNILYKRKFKRKVEISFRPDDNITLKNMLLSLDNLVANSPLKTEIPKVEVQKVKSLKEVMNEVQERINRFLKINFKEIVQGGNKKEVSVSFLAILELFRNGEVNLFQNEAFGNIEIEKTK
ncbi:hypothetical protein CSB11_01035 [Candidatus Campbellbacteria bacterium]|nr:MAG: hypothetical protein CSB11_01035 [Candidatus Campbellbacteria bacterium]